MGMYDMNNLMAAIRNSNLAVSFKITDEAFKTQLNGLHERAAQIMQDYKAGADMVATDTTLTPSGKLEKRRVLMTTALSKLEELETSTALYKKEADSLVEKADVDAPSDNPVLDYLMQKEIRDKVGDNAQAEVLYIYAVQHDNNPALVEAFESAPMPYDFVTEGTRAKTRQNKLMKKNPKDATRVKDIDLFTVCLNNTLSAAKDILGQHQ